MAKRKLESMNQDHNDLIQQFIEEFCRNNPNVVNNGLMNRQGRGAHEISINGVPYWIIQTG